MGERKAAKSTLWIDKTEWLGDRKIAVTCKCESANPLLIGAPAINYTFVITIDRTDISHPKYSLTGQHDGFPAYEIYINHTRVYEHDPLATGDTGRSLLPPDDDYKPNKVNQPLP